MDRKDWNGNGHSVKVNIKLLFFGGVKRRPFHSLCKHEKLRDCESFSVN